MSLIGHGLGLSESHIFTNLIFSHRQDPWVSWRGQFENPGRVGQPSHRHVYVHVGLLSMMLGHEVHPHHRLLQVIFSCPRTLIPHLYHSYITHAYDCTQDLSRQGFVGQPTTTSWRISDFHEISSRGSLMYQNALPLSTWMATWVLIMMYRRLSGT